MATLIILAVMWTVFAVGILLFACMASAQFSRWEEEPVEVGRRNSLSRQNENVPAAANLRQVSARR